MIIDTQYIRPFPEPAEVFATEVEKHAHFFLPICSIDMNNFQPEKYSQPFWVHIVQPSEICEGRVGEDTKDWHDEYNEPDQMCFDVNDEGKYTFSGDWDYFVSNHTYNPVRYKKAKNWADKSGKDLADCLKLLDADVSAEYQTIIKENHLYHKLVKTYYQKNQRMPAISYHFEDYFEQAVENDTPFDEVFSEFVKADKEWNYHGATDYIIMEDVAGLSKGMQEWITEENVHSIDEILNRDGEMGNLHSLPRNATGEVFNYIGWLTGFRFQHYGCDELNIFYDYELQKLVICLVYS